MTMAKRGFTMIEMLLAVMILAIVTTVTAISYTSVLNNWKKSTDIVDRMQTADYAVNQIVAGLRSAYYPSTGENSNMGWGLQLVDGGEGEDQSDSDWIEWTKMGTAIIGDKLQAAETSHKVRLWVEEARNHGEQGGLFVRTWNAELVNENARDYDEEDIGDEFLLVPDVVGFDCQIQKDPKAVDADGRPEWEDEWDTSNSIPYRVKLTFRMKPAEGMQESIPIMRVVTIPLWDISQNPISTKGDNDGGKGKSSSGTGSSSSGGNKGGSGGNKGGSTGTTPGSRPSTNGGRPGGIGGGGGMVGPGGGGPAGGGGMR
jgi:prepilin-type N-terminal cleavage/methylation domain-containing protein